MESQDQPLAASIDLTALKVGKAFAAGYLGGASAGVITSYARAFHQNEPPLVQLNSTLNTASLYANRCAYATAITEYTTCLADTLSNKAHLSQFMKSTVKVGVAGATIGSFKGPKGTLGGGLIGAAVGAAYGYYKYKPTLENLFTEKIE